jgi:predicted Holliday junction resolvase-like endonuclease
MSEMNVQSVTFLEVKTGNSKLAPHERMVRDAIDDKKIFYKAI